MTITEKISKAAEVKNIGKGISHPYQPLIESISNFLTGKEISLDTLDLLYADTNTLDAISNLKSVDATLFDTNLRLNVGERRPVSMFMDFLQGELDTLIHTTAFESKIKEQWSPCLTVEGGHASVFSSLITDRPEDVYKMISAAEKIIPNAVKRNNTKDDRVVFIIDPLKEVQVLSDLKTIFDK